MLEIIYIPAALLFPSEWMRDARCSTIASCCSGINTNIDITVYYALLTQRSRSY